MADWQIESRTKADAYLATLPFRDLQGEFYYSKTQEVRFSMSLSSLKDYTQNDIYPAKTEIVVKRNGVAIFCGPLWSMSISSQDNKVSLMAQDISSYFTKRDIKSEAVLSGAYGDIAWSLISESQSRTNGNLYITRGTTVGGSAPSGNYTPTNGATLADTLEDIYSGSNGFDWVITPQRVYNQFYPRINSNANVRLEYGANIKSYSSQIQGIYIGNSVRALGKDKLLTSSVVDTTSQGIYGLMEHVESATGLENIGLLNDVATQTLADRRNPKDIPQIVLNSTLVNPFEGDITYGQLARIIINDGYISYDKVMKNVGFQLTVGRHGEETFNLYLNDM